MHIVVDADHIVASNGSDLFAVRPAGTPLWRTSLATGLVTLRRWGDQVLVSDSRRLWLFDIERGTQQFLAEVVVAEETDSGSDNADNLVVQVGAIALGENLAFVNLGTATIAVDRVGNRIWRTPRPPRLGTEVRAGAGGPAAANGRWLLTHNLGPAGVHTTLRDVASGEVEWAVTYALGAGGARPAPGAGPPAQGGPPGAGPEADEDWYRVEGRLADPWVVLREARELHVLSLATGRIQWEFTSATPVASLDVVGDLVLVGADRLTAYTINNGAKRWQTDLRGARFAGTRDGRLVIAASTTDGVVSALNGDGAPEWRTPIPDEFADAVVEAVSVDEHTAYVTFKPRGVRQQPLNADVLAIALDSQAKRVVR